MRRYLTATFIAFYSLFVMPSFCAGGILEFCCEHGHQGAGPTAHSHHHGHGHGHHHHDHRDHDGTRCEPCADGAHSHHDCSGHDVCGQFVRSNDDDEADPLNCGPVTATVAATALAPVSPSVPPPPREFRARIPSLPFPATDLPQRV